MLSIHLDNVGKKFGREWVFRNLDLKLQPADRMVILGGNGSGKSTLLQVIAGYITPNEGGVNYSSGTSAIEKSLVNEQISFASPYLQLLEDLTGPELVTHIGKFKSFLNKMSAAEVFDRAELGAAKDKFIRQYSSGMKQRLKLALALFADTPLVLLDEPLSNLDVQAIQWYKNLVATYSGNRTVVVCSNAIAHEYEFCTRSIDLADFKTKIRP